MRNNLCRFWIKKVKSLIERTRLGRSLFKKHTHFQGKSEIDIISNHRISMEIDDFKRKNLRNNK